MLKIATEGYLIIYYYLQNVILMVYFTGKERKQPIFGGNK